MTYIVAIAGKGGVGKSTLSSMLIQALSERTGEIILAVDADPNANLGDKLGVEVEGTIGQLREDLLERADEIPTGVSKQDMVMYHLRLAMVEGKKFDLITMGRQEGRGCYCYINNLLRTFLDNVMEDYPYVVIDNEAGMEHLSRRTCQRMDALIVVSDPTSVGITTARRILELAKEMEIDFSSNLLVINRVKGELPANLLEDIEDAGFDNWTILPHDEEIELLTEQGLPLTGLSRDNISTESIRKLAQQLR
ncbi:MAG: AAA family ATPase [Euryarchaeota archaeon]|nr:AAA family ATPase [Euryarchaeota archaeon]